MTTVAHRCLVHKDVEEMASVYVVFVGVDLDILVTIVVHRMMVSIQSEGAAREWSTVVKISTLPLSLKPVPLSLSHSPLL